MQKYIFTILLTLSLLCSCSSSQNESNGAISCKMDSIFSQIFPENLPGAIVMVTIDDSVVYNHGFGLARLDKPNTVSDSTMFNICSLSKQFSAVALLLLQEKGLISLDDKVTDYFPEFKNPIFKNITLRHLLSHTSGLPDTRPRNKSQWIKYTQKHPSIYSSGTDYRRYGNDVESIRFFESLDSLAFEPGSAYEYQNPTYQLVYSIVEKVTGIDFDTWMRNNIFLPAGMDNTIYFSPEKTIPNMAHAYRAVNGKTIPGKYISPDGKWEEYDYGEADFFPTKADGGIYTSAAEFMKWQKALYADKVISADSRKLAMSKIIPTDTPDTYYGLGFFINDTPGKPLKIYHTGDNGGFYTYQAAFPDKNISYLIFATRQGWDRMQAAEEIDKILKNEGWLN